MKDVSVDARLDQPVLVPAQREIELIETILETLGASAEERAAQAHVLVEADLRGHPSHGIQRLPLLVERIRHGVLVPRARRSHVWTTAAVLEVDGGNGFGPAAGVEAIDRIAARAKEIGAAVAVIQRSNHLGMLATYLERIAAHDQIGIGFTTSEALVHPFGGTSALVGTNPIGLGIPTGASPFVFDMATATVSMGRIIDHLNRGVPLPAGWTLDRDGRATTDPAAALEGSIAPYGGPKGYGLGLGIELLVAMLTQTAVGREVTGTLDATTLCNKGDVFVCLDPAAFVDGFDPGALGAYLDVVRSDRPAEGFASVQVPGDRARALRTERLRDGVPVSATIWRQVVELERVYGGKA